MVQLPGMHNLEPQKTAMMRTIAKLTFALSYRLWPGRLAVLIKDLSSPMRLRGMYPTSTCSHVLDLYQDIESAPEY